MHSLYGEEKMTTKELLIKAKNAKAELGLVSVEKINEALLAMADCLVEDTAEILRNNAEDIEKARGTVSDVMLDRLSLSEERIEGMAQGVRDVAALPSPVGKVLMKRNERRGGACAQERQRMCAQRRQGSSQERRGDCKGSAEGT